MDKFETLTKFDDFLAEQLKNEEFKKEYDALESEFTVIQAILEARIETGLTQKQLSEKTGISQADISRIERGTANPSLKTLQRIADALGKKLVLQLV